VISLASCAHLQGHAFCTAVGLGTAQERAMENDLRDVTRRLGDNFDEIRHEVGQRTQEIREYINSLVAEQPLAAVGIAFGVGYLLSGALVSRTTFRVARLGGRVVLGELVKQLFAGVGPAVLLAAGLSREGERASGGPGRGGDGGARPRQ
jgi:ElaB/YqjD/DUF883 family membrane-anchored ribosome-binding protein